MKDDDWVDAVAKKSSVTFTDSIYEEMSDDSLFDMRKKVNAEWDKRQLKRVQNLHSMLNVRKEIQG